ncbi:uncharacterized protein LOC126749758 [Anthonomus grandis grandis]|uniref:uncharacterized protein LOC126749758 n=1 Tax=Anthonomus grandis grandis TaxID=2921223 RepID=UPI002165DA88|nr:uncharacterized protein LOC126749758 [Anthonomus grandis grandis]
MLPSFFGLALIVLFYGYQQCSAVNDFSSSNYFCKKFHRQQVIDDSQLEGIWYVIEKIIHMEDRDYRLNLTTCPVLHISRDNVESTTYNPIYKNYDTTYGAQYPHRLPQQEPENINLRSNPTNRDSTFTSQQDYNRQLDDFDRRTTYDYERRRAMQNVYAQLYGTKYLNLYLSDGRDTVIHHVRYNSSEPSYWIISGPEYGVPDNLQHFIGNMQVLKVVGSHMVLTVCKHLKEVKQLYSLVLSRENFLSSQDVSGVHRMLISQALRTNYVEKTCSGTIVGSFNWGLGCLVFVFYLIKL